MGVNVDVIKELSDTVVSQNASTKSKNSGDFKSKLSTALKSNKLGKQALNDKTQGENDDVTELLENLINSIKEMKSADSNKPDAVNSKDALSELLQQLNSLLDVIQKTSDKSSDSTDLNKEIKTKDNSNSNEVQALLQLLDSLSQMLKSDTKENKNDPDNILSIKDIKDIKDIVQKKITDAKTGSDNSKKIIAESKQVDVKSESKNTGEALNIQAESDAKSSTAGNKDDMKVVTAKAVSSGSASIVSNLSSKSTKEDDTSNLTDAGIVNSGNIKKADTENANSLDELTKEQKSNIAANNYVVSDEPINKQTVLTVEDILKKLMQLNQTTTQNKNTAQVQSTGSNLNPSTNVFQTDNANIQIINALVAKLSEKHDDVKDVNTAGNTDEKASQGAVAKTDQVQTILSNIKLIKQSVEAKSSESGNAANSMNSKADSDTKDAKFLNDLADSDSSKQKLDGSSINKVNNFMNMLNDVKDNADISQVEKPAISKENMFNDVIKTVKYMENNDVKNLTVKITPRDLGELVIKLTSEGGVMKANISASTKEAYNILNANIDRISSELNNQDYKVNNLTLSLYDENATNHNSSSGNGQQNNSNSKSGTHFFFEEDTEQAADKAVNGEGNLDIII